MAQETGALPIKVELQPKLKVMGFNILPMIGGIYSLLPKSTATKMKLKGFAPKTEVIPDWYDHFGEDPYEIKEVEKDRVWKVTYYVEEFLALSKEAQKAAGLLGTDWTDEETKKRVLDAAGEHKEQALKDMAHTLEVKEKVLRLGNCKETVELCGKSIQTMIVVKLNSGKLLLYSPVRIRDELSIGKFLKDIGGEVTWVLAPSSAHTLMLPSILKKYPDAKFVTSRDSKLKLETGGWLPNGKPDFDYTEPAELQEANNLLKNEGVTLHFVDGDVGTSALIAIAFEKVAMECDIIYSTGQGMSMFGLSDEEMMKDEPGRGALRLFKWGLASKPTSPNDALPPYRFWMMDPKGAMSALVVTVPKADGSSCTDMARSLRHILSLNFEKAVGSHLDVLTRDEFRHAVDRNWNWLDGKSLL